MVSSIRRRRIGRRNEIIVAKPHAGVAVASKINEKERKTRRLTSTVDAVRSTRLVVMARVALLQDIRCLRVLLAILSSGQEEDHGRTGQGQITFFNLSALLRCREKEAKRKKEVWWCIAPSSIWSNLSFPF